MSPDMVELEQQPRTMRLRPTTIFVCKNRVLIRNSLCTKSTYGIHCLLSLQSHIRPNNRACKASISTVTIMVYTGMNNNYDDANS